MLREKILSLVKRGYDVKFESVGFGNTSISVSKDDCSTEQYIPLDHHFEERKISEVLDFCENKLEEYLKQHKEREDEIA